MHGEYLVGFCSEEKVDKKHASSIVVVRPNTHPEDVRILKAKVSDDGYSIEIISPSKCKSYLAHSAQWLGKLKTNEERFKAHKLGATLQAMVTKLKRKTRTKTTTISVKHLDIELSNENFNVGAGNNELAMIPLPYTYEMELGKKGNKSKVTEVVCVWRAYVVNSEHDVDEDAPPVEGGDYDIMLKMMEESTI